MESLQLESPEFRDADTIRGFTRVSMFGTSYRQDYRIL